LLHWPPVLLHVVLDSLCFHGRRSRDEITIRLPPSRANQDIRRHPAAVGAAASRSPARLLLSTVASGRVEVAAMCSSLPSPSSHMAPWNWKLVLCLGLQAAVEAAAAGDQRENVMGQKRHGRSVHGPRDLIVFNFVIYILCTLGFPFADDS
jgi:hypothetical protein